MSAFGPVQRWTWKLGATPTLHERVYDGSGRLVRLPLGPWVRDITYDDADRISRYTHYTAATAQPATAEEHPFGHPDLPGGLNHDCPHFVATNAKGVSVEFPYRPGS